MTDSNHPAARKWAGALAFAGALSLPLSLDEGDPRPPEAAHASATPRYEQYDPNGTTLSQGQYHSLLKMALQEMDVASTRFGGDIGMLGLMQEQQFTLKFMPAHNGVWPNLTIRRNQREIHLPYTAQLFNFMISGARQVSGREHRRFSAAEIAGDLNEEYKIKNGSSLPDSLLGAKSNTVADMQALADKTAQMLSGDYKRGLPITGKVTATIPLLFTGECNFTVDDPRGAEIDLGR